MLMSHKNPPKKLQPTFVTGVEMVNRRGLCRKRFPPNFVSRLIKRLLFKLGKLFIYDPVSVS